MSSFKGSIKQKRKTTIKMVRRIKHQAMENLLGMQT
jgi:hypothetical protein